MESLTCSIRSVIKPEIVQPSLSIKFAEAGVIITVRANSHDGLRVAVATATRMGGFSGLRSAWRYQIQGDISQAWIRDLIGLLNPGHTAPVPAPAPTAPVLPSLIPTFPRASPPQAPLPDLERNARQILEHLQANGSYPDFHSIKPKDRVKVQRYIRDQMGWHHLSQAELAAIAEWVKQHLPQKTI
jgi:hypothetical protein